MRLHDPDFCLQERLTLIHRRRREYVQEHILIFSGTIDAARFLWLHFLIFDFSVRDVPGQEKISTALQTNRRLPVLVPDPV